jgi:hypothetical protein
MVHFETKFYFLNTDGIEYASDVIFVVIASRKTSKPVEHRLIIHNEFCLAKELYNKQQTNRVDSNIAVSN